jgi:uncharacterized membrane protein YdcZ (DUF606 family)
VVFRDVCANFVVTMWLALSFVTGCCVSLCQSHHWHECSSVLVARFRSYYSGLVALMVLNFGRAASLT